MQAIILAAGLGRRLGELTSDNTKCMVEVNGVTLIDRMLGQLVRADISRVVIIIGYKGDKLRDYIGNRYPMLQIEYVENDVYASTNNIYSLWLAKDRLVEDDTLLLESDIIFEEGMLQKLLDDPDPDVALVAKYEPWMDGTMVRLDQLGYISSFVPKSAFNYDEIELYYKTVNIYKFSKNFISSYYLPFLEAYIKAMGNNEYYEQVLRVVTMIDSCNIKGLPVGSLRWYEIDDVQDLRIAEVIFSDAEHRLSMLQKSFGGYWRYAGLKDFCYLVNPYFPTAKMISEMQANFEPLLRQYPSGMDINTLLASKYFGIRQSYTAIGNGAAELIKELMTITACRVGVTIPTFEEYVNRMPKDNVVAFRPANSSFAYSAKDLIEFFADKEISALLLVNPDNPSGNFIRLTSDLSLLNWAKELGIRLIVDESFVDFATDGLQCSLLDNELLERFPNLCVVKSISKSYGVPGLRLGVVASSDVDLISELRHGCSIWNINSFAEYYMQIFGKYETDYRRACMTFAKVRDKFYDELSSLECLRVIPSQANYFLCEVMPPFTAHGLALKLLTDFNILIKDCSTKKGFQGGAQYVRIAVRDVADNDAIVYALRAIMKQPVC
ncbi:MAG: aminotransferase class I/II-fold pyridoxal phosphate-dependent enzyme [Muribaculum sp.]|nr:aminotransferase class I/II-fold pyridoxal phosphate-dependent enzyme [Muribaculum sp.]